MATAALPPITTMTDSPGSIWVMLLIRFGVRRRTAVIVVVVEGGVACAATQAWVPRIR